MLKQVLYSILILVLIIVTGEVNGQDKSGSLGNIYIPEKGSISVFGIHHFDYGGYLLQPGIVKTCRNSLSEGILYFATQSQWNGADELKHVDGFVGHTSDDLFVFPLGHDGVYSPIVTKSPSGIVVSYNNVNPVEVTGGINNSEIESIASKGYWKIMGNNASEINLPWNAQNSDNLGIADSNLERLSIIGWNGQNWEIIPSKVQDNKWSLDSSTPEFLNESVDAQSGVISTLGSIQTEDYDYLTIGVVDADIADFVNNDGNVGLQIKVFPNPSVSLDEMTIAYKLDDVDSQDGYLEVYDLIGNLLYKSQITLDKLGFLYTNSSLNLSSGDYVIRVITNRHIAMEEIIIVD